MTSGSWCSSYTLFGVISHKGPRLSSGHYVARVKDANGTWRMFNDEEVTRTGDGSAMPLELEDAYVLFYMNSKHLRVLEVRAEIARKNGRTAGAAAVVGDSPRNVSSVEVKPKASSEDRPVSGLWKMISEKRKKWSEPNTGSSTTSANPFTALKVAAETQQPEPQPQSEPQPQPQPDIIDLVSPERPMKRLPKSSLKAASATVKTPTVAAAGGAKPPADPPSTKSTISKRKTRPAEDTKATAAKDWADLFKRAGPPAQKRKRNGKKV